MLFDHDEGSIKGLLTIDTSEAPPLGGETQSFKIQGTGALYIPFGTTAERPLDNSPPDVARMRYNTDTGNIEVHNGISWLKSIDESNLLTFKDANVITVSKQADGHDFTSIKAALDSIVDAAHNNLYIVRVGPGTFVEDPFTIPSFVSVEGCGNASTEIVASTTTSPLVTGSPAAGINNVTLKGATGVGGSAIYYTGFTLDSNAFGQVFHIQRVAFGNNETQVKVTSYGLAIMICRDCTMGGTVNGEFTEAFVVDSPWPNFPDQVTNAYTPLGFTASYIAVQGMAQQNLTGNLPTNFIRASGIGTQLFVSGSVIYTNQSLNIAENPSLVFGSAVDVTDGAQIVINSSYITGWNKAIYTHQSGNNLPTKVYATGTIIEDSFAKDIDIDDPGTQGYIVANLVYNKISINDSSPFFVSGQDLKVITVAKRGGDFTSIADAISAIVSSSEMNRYLIYLGPGLYIEPELDLSAKPYVSVAGLNIQGAVIRPDSSSHHVFKLGPWNELSFFTIEDAGPGYAGIAILDSGDFSQAHKVSFSNCDIGILLTSATQNTYFDGEYLDFDGDFSYAVYANATNGYDAYASLENFYVYPVSISSPALPSSGIYASGLNTKIDINTFGLEGSMFGVGVYAEDQAIVNLNSGHIINFSYGVHIGNVGLPAQINLLSVTNNNELYNIWIEHPSGTGSFVGTMSDYTKILSDSAFFGWNFLDSNDGELHLSNNLQLHYSNGEVTNVSTAIQKSLTAGIYSGGVITAGAPLSIDITAGFGYIETVDGLSIKRVNWDAQSLLLPTDSVSYIYIDETSNTAQYAGALPNTTTTVYLGRIITNSDVEIIDATGVDALHTPNKLSLFNREALGPVYVSGSIVTENIGSPTLQLDITTGSYYFSEIPFTPTGGTAISFMQYNHNGSASWETTVTTFVNNTQWNNGNILTALSTGYFTKHTLYTVGDGVNEKYLLVLGQSEHASLQDCITSNLPSPPSYFDEGITLIAVIYVQEGNNNIVDIEDARPRIGFKASGTAGSSNHGDLQGLLNDDHTQYLLASGARAMTGNLNAGGYNITNVGTVDGVDVSAHVSRHAFNGSDPLTPADAADITELADTTSSAGINNTKIPRADHVHAHGNRGGGSLHSAATVSVAGFMSAADKTKLDAITGTNTGNDSTSVTGILKGNGSTISAATAGTDYSAGTSALSTGIVKSTTGTGTLSIATFSDLPINLYKENASSPTTPSATGTNAVAIGSGSAASSINGVGVGDGSSARIWGQKAYANGSFATAGDAQRGVYILRATTTNNTSTELFLDGAGSSQRLVLPNNSCFTFSALITARRTDATGGGAGYKLEGVIKRDGTAASTVLVGTPAKTILGETDAAWDVAVTADTTNGSIRIAVTGQNAKTIRWVATVTTTEVTN